MNTNEIRERLSRITTAPWKHDGMGIYIFSEKDNSMIVEVRGWGHLTGKMKLSFVEAATIQGDVGDFIANAPTDIAFLLDEVERLTAELEAELRQYQKLKDEGLLVELPCRVGDIVYMRYMNCDHDYKLENCSDHEGGCKNCEHKHPIAIKRFFNLDMIQQFGESYFLTREEAERAMEDKEKC